MGPGGQYAGQLFTLLGLKTTDVRQDASTSPVCQRMACVCARACKCIRVHMRVCACECVHVLVRACVMDKGLNQVTSFQFRGRPKFRLMLPLPSTQ